MTNQSVPEKSGRGRSSNEEPLGAPPGLSEALAARARYEREVAALDLSDAEQAEALAQADLPFELYGSADRHRILAERLDAGDASAMLDAESIDPPIPGSR